jgi:hypothetical protein
MDDAALDRVLRSAISTPRKGAIGLAGGTGEEEQTKDM